MSKRLLIIDQFASVYADAIGPAFPHLRIETAARQEDVANAETCDILISFGNTLTDDLYARTRSLTWVQSLATGVDQFLRNSRFPKDALLTSARGIHAAPMRETVAFLMLGISRDATRLVADKAAKRWERGSPWPILAGKTAVVVGTGVSGEGIAHLMKAFGMRTIAVTRTPRAIPGFDEVMAQADLAGAAARADYLINVLPGGTANAGAISRDVIGAMKSTAYFINVGRGETVDEVALIDALQQRRIAGAGLDVVSRTPLPADSPIWTLPNVFLSPHIGGFFAEYEEHVMPIILHNIDAYLGGRFAQMKNVVRPGWAAL